LPIASLDDEALIRHFAKLAVPVGLVAHKRALEAALSGGFTQGASL